jgi:hypothetical protein
LIELGIRDCNAPKTNEPRIMVESAAAGKPPLAAQPGAEKPLLAGLMDRMQSVFGAVGAAGTMHSRAVVSPPRPDAKPALREVLPAEIPLPPARPVQLTLTDGATADQAPGQPTSEAALAEAAQTVPLPARRPPVAVLSAEQRLARAALPKIMTGAQPILPPSFSAYAEWTARLCPEKVARLFRSGHAPTL